MALIITRRYGQGFTLIWPNGHRRHVRLIGASQLEITGVGAAVVNAPYTIMVSGDPHSAVITIGDPKEWDDTQHSVLIEAPRAIAVHRDNMKKGH